MLFRTTPQSQGTIAALWRLQKIILNTLDFNEVVQKIVDSVLTELGDLKLGYRIVVLSLLDEEKKVLKRISISQTEEAKKALAVTPVPFHEIDIPITEPNNICAKSVRDVQVFTTHDWFDILQPAYTREEAAQVQKVVGIKTSMVFPVISKGKAIGFLIFSMVKDEKEVSEAERDLIQGFTDVVGLAVENAKLYTSLSETEKQLESANERLKELDKLKDDFVSVASHELRTPMTAIKSYLWVALNQHYKELSPDMQRYLNRAYISVERLINMVNDMLNISRIEGGRIALRLAETDLVVLSREVYDEILTKANEKNIDVVIVQKNVPKVLCDKDKIHEVLLNLIGNSLKFTKAGGTISVNFTAQDPYITISVTDTGVGISSENLAKLFTKFGRLENSYVAIAESGGTGLGLFISKSLVELHKGTIKASSPGTGKGTTFSFTLPIVGSQVAQDLAKSAPKETENTKELEKTKLYLN